MSEPLEMNVNFETSDTEMNLEADMNCNIEVPLPIASATQLGGIKVGENLSIAADGTLSAEVSEEDIEQLQEDVTDLKEDLSGVAISDGCIIYYDGTFSSNGSSSWPARSCHGMVSKWNGTFGTGTSNYFHDLLYPYNYASTTRGVTNTFYDFTQLQVGHIYSIESYILSGTLTASEGKIANIVITNILTIPIGGKGTFEYNGNVPKFYFHFSSGVALSNAVIAVVVKDITTKENNGVTQKLLSGYVWRQGKHVNRNQNLETVNDATDTMTLIGSIPYDTNMYFILSDGWKAQFVSVENGVVVGISTKYIETSGRIDMIDVYNNLNYNSVNVFGDSLCINIRKMDNSVISPETVNVDDALQMYVVNQGCDATKPKTWVAIGDSITDGRYSQSDGTVRTKTNHFCQYGYIASKLLGIESYVEQGYGGMGYVHVANDGTYLTDVLALDFGAPDIITVCLGINDRSQPLGDHNSESNDGTISGAIKNCCEVLGNKYKNAQIIFLTPINGTSTGTLDTGWCKRSGTTHLSDIADMIKYWANLYGFAVIDMLNSSPINDFNIQSLILDGLHPTMEAHYMVGHYLAGELPYKTC